jgi:hypothetical protein
MIDEAIVGVKVDDVGKRMGIPLVMNRPSLFLISCLNAVLIRLVS